MLESAAPAAKCGTARIDLEASLSCRKVKSSAKLRLSMRAPACERLLHSVFVVSWASHSQSNIRYRTLINRSWLGPVTDLR